MVVNMAGGNPWGTTENESKDCERIQHDEGDGGEGEK